jgi:sensor histidine kinase YesM
VFGSTRISPFWRFQLLGWLLFAAATFPFKLYAYQTVGAALIITATREPLGFAVSSLLRLLYRRFHVAHAQLVVLIVAASTVAGVIDTLLGAQIASALGVSEEPFVTFGVFIFRGTIYLSWSLLYFWFKAQRSAHERELNLAHAETTRREAELQLLRTQVNPHFLFNALNTVLATLEPDQARPKRVVEGLAAYLRYSLQHRHDALVPLHAEFDATVAYLAVEQERFRGELLVEATLDPAARDVPVPGVLLQPLVENAVKYSRQTSDPPHHVHLRVALVGPAEIVVEVRNTGLWLSPSPTPGPHGTGLENLRRRLALLYPERHELATSSADGWVVVRLRISDRGLRPDAPLSQQPTASR